MKGQRPQCSLLYRSSELGPRGASNVRLRWRLPLAPRSLLRGGTGTAREGCSSEVAARYRLPKDLAEPFCL